MLTPQQIKEIEEEFDEQFDHIVPSQGGFIVGKKGSQYDNCACDLTDIKSFFITTINNILAETEKAFGGCKLCYGKGYATVKDRTKCYADFIGDKSYVKENNPVKPCTCDRGKQIEKLINIK